MKMSVSFIPLSSQYIEYLLFLKTFMVGMPSIKPDIYSILLRPCGS